MAQELDDLEFWLPSEFLTDDDLLTDFKTDRFKTRRIDDFSYGFGNSFGLSSDLSSPLELVTSTAETESDDDDLISELRRKFAHSTLQVSNLSSDCTTKGWKLSGSPQSTLCGCKRGSRGSPNSVSGVCSPPDAEDFLRWDFLYAAADEVARMRMIEEAAASYSSKLFALQAKPRPVTAHQPNPNPNPNPASGFYPNQAQSQSHISYQLLQAAKFQQLKQHQMLKNRVYGQGVAEFQLQNGRRNGGEARAQGLSMSAWPTLQQTHQQPGSGMRAVFLGETGTKKERTGTGVFLPKRIGSVPAETRKKPAGCSTVLLPERVVHALNFNVDSIDARVQQRSNGSINTDYDAALKHRHNVMMAQQRRSLVPQPVMNQQLRLPLEWTY